MSQHINIPNADDVLTFVRIIREQHQKISELEVEINDLKDDNTRLRGWWLEERNKNEGDDKCHSKSIAK